jgi:hypothetical protein
MGHCGAMLLVALAAGCSGNRDLAKPATAAPAESAPATAGGSHALAGSPVNQALVKQGYRPKMYDGRLLYCRSEMITGTNFRSQVCLTEAQVADLARQSEHTQDDLKRSHAGPCLPPACSN